MPDHLHVYAGTAGHSAWFSEDGGRQWVHPNSHSGMYLEARVWSFASHPSEPETLWAGTDMGLYKWHEPSARWASVALPSPNPSDIWVVAVHPEDPKILWIGTRPAGCMMSPDGGQTWRTINVPGLQSFSTINMGATRVTQIAFDPLDPQAVWMTVEIGGIFFSPDGGTTWHPRDQGLVSCDVHGIALVDVPQLGSLGTTQRLMYATTNRYTRSIVQRADHTGVMFLTNGNGPPGDDGKLLISTDHGQHWQAVDLPGRINSTVWTVATHHSNPQQLFTCTNLGQVFESTDGGHHWQRLHHEFGELRALHWRPLPAGIRQQAHSITQRPPP
ncbi:MAG: hypothetical protein EBR27_04210 [Betaproteobacteria bacterium]|nr:hypothetical protein [Betaproteobacteria bacterium]